MATASASGNTIYVSWSSFGVSGNTVKNYNIEIMQGSSIVKSEYGISSSSRSWTFYGLSYNTYYTVKVYAQMSIGANKVEYAYVTTGAPPIPPPSTPSGLYLTGKGNGYLSFAWNYQYDADYYCMEIFHSATGSMVWSNYSITSTSVTASYGLSAGINYYAKLYARNSAGNSGATYLYNLTPSDPIPDKPSAIGATALSSSGQVYASWYSVTYASYYYVTVRADSLFGTQVWSNYVYGTNTTITGLSEFRTYYVTVSGVNSSGQAGDYNYTSVKTLDLTPPTISTITGDGNGKMYVSFSAYDNGSGMRPTSTYYTEITSAGGSTYGQGAYGTNTYRTFTMDASGKEFVHNSYYTMRVIAFDAQANSSNRTVQVQYKVARPVSWVWNYAKLTNQPVNITASEWNSFCLRINQFRQYKNLANYSFTTVTSGSVITATIVNQAVTAIGAMVSTHAPVKTGDKITAFFFNKLRDDLNSIP